MTAGTLASASSVVSSWSPPVRVRCLPRHLRGAPARTPRDHQQQVVRGCRRAAPAPRRSRTPPCPSARTASSPSARNSSTTRSPISPAGSATPMTLRSSPASVAPPHREESGERAEPDDQHGKAQRGDEKPLGLHAHHELAADHRRDPRRERIHAAASSSSLSSSCESPASVAFSMKIWRSDGSISSKREIRAPLSTACRSRACGSRPLHHADLHVRAVRRDVLDEIRRIEERGVPPRRTARCRVAPPRP